MLHGCRLFVTFCRPFTPFELRGSICLLLSPPCRDLTSGHIVPSLMSLLSIEHMTNALSFWPLCALRTSPCLSMSFCVTNGVRPHFPHTAIATAPSRMPLCALMCKCHNDLALRMLYCAVTHAACLVLTYMKWTQWDSDCLCKNSRFYFHCKQPHSCCCEEDPDSKIQHKTEWCLSY